MIPLFIILPAPIFPVLIPPLVTLPTMLIEFAYTVPVPDTVPDPNNKLPPVTLPETLRTPVMYSPVVEKTATLPVPPMPIVTLPFTVGMFTLLVPLAM